MTWDDALDWPQNATPRSYVDGALGVFSGASNTPTTGPSVVTAELLRDPAGQPYYSVLHCSDGGLSVSFPGTLKLTSPDGRFAESFKLRLASVISDEFSGYVLPYVKAQLQPKTLAGTVQGTCPAGTEPSDPPYWIDIYSVNQPKFTSQTLIVKIALQCAGGDAGYANVVLLDATLPMTSVAPW